MFLIEPTAGLAGLRADLAPRRLSYGAGDLVRAALLARQTTEAARAPAERTATQLDLALPPTRRRKAG
jgi:hypothetical protein